MEFFYKVGAKFTTRAMKRAEKTLGKVFNKQFEWSFDYLRKHYPIKFSDYIKAFKLKYKVKCINKDSLLYNQLKSQYIGYKLSLQFDTMHTYVDYLNCVKDVANDLPNIKDSE